MSKTEISGKQILDGSIELTDLSATLSGTITQLQTDVAAKADTSSLATVATTGSYSDLSNKPTIPSLTGYATESYVNTAISGKADSSSLATVATSGSYSDLTNKPTIPSDLNSLSDVVITSASTDQVIKYDGTNWINSAAPAGGISSLNSLSGSSQTFATGTSGTNFAISSSGTTHTFNLPDASSTARGLVTTGAQTFTGTKTIQTAAAADKGLILKASASQTSPLLELQNSAGTQTFRINADGTIRVLQTGTNVYYTVQNAFNESIYSQWNDSAGGWLYVGTQIYFGIQFGFDSTKRCFRLYPNGENVFYMNSLDNGAGVYTWTVARDTSKNCFSFSIGGTGHAWNFATANSTGGFGIDLTGAPEAKLHVNGTLAARKGMIIRGAASQTANLIEAQNSGGTAVFSVSSAGDVSGLSGTFIGTATDGFPLYSKRPASHARAGLAVFDSGWKRLFAVGYDTRYTGSAASGLTSEVQIGSDDYAFTTLGYHGASNCLKIISRSDTFVQFVSPDISGTNGNGIAYLTLTRDQTTASVNIQASNHATSLRLNNTVHATRYVETAGNAFSTSLAPSSGTLTVDTSVGNAVLGALGASVTTWAFTNVPTDNSRVTTITAVLVGNASYTYGDACSVNGTAITNGIQWSGGSAPTATSGTDIITFIIVRDSAGTVKVFGSATTNFS